MAERRIYGYARVSSTSQDLGRQLEAFEKLGIEERNIFKDKASGKNFDRKAYNNLVGTDEVVGSLREGDLLVIYSIDRLGRDYTEIRNEWNKITKELKCDIKVIDMPLLDTSKGAKDLDSTFMADLVLQILSYVAQRERENILARQKGGMDIMETKMDKVNGKTKKHSNKTGRPIGRPAIEYPDGWEDVYQAWKNKEIKGVDAMDKLNLKKNSFYNLVKRYESK